MSAKVPGSEYAKATEFHHRIEALYPRIEAHKSWFCDMQLVGRNVPAPAGTRPYVDCGRVFCALAIKAATTKRSIHVLCEAGDGDNASALERVLLENSILMRWLLGGSGRDRLETYILFMGVLHVRAIRVVTEYFPDRPEFVALVKATSDPYHRAVAASVFLNRDDTWAYFPNPDRPGRLRKVRIAEMFEEVAPDRFPYRGPYAMGSQFIHSGPDSLMQILPNLVGARYVKVEPMPSPIKRTMALSFSNAHMLTALAALDDFVGLDLAEAIDAIANEWKALVKTTLDETTDSTSE